MAREKASNTIMAQNIKHTFEGETVENAVEEMLDELNSHEFTWVLRSLELKAKTKLQNKGFTAGETKPLMSIERKRIHKRLKRHPRLTEAGTRETLNAYSEKIKDNTINSHHVEDHKFYLLTKTDKKPRINAARALVYIYTATAQLEHNQNRDITAWKAMAKAQYYRGLLTGLDDPNTHLVNERASQGGKARAQKIKQQKHFTQIAEQTMLDLLNKMVPQAKWRNYSTAAEAVVDPLLEAIKIDGIQLTSDRDDLKSILMNLIMEYKDAFIKS